MKRRGTTASVIAIAVCATGAVASAAPAFQNILAKDQSYAEARKALRASGWRPLATDDREADGTLVKSWGDTRAMAEAGMVEVRRCSGTGPNFCEFWWRKGRSCLRVITQGEYRPEHHAPRVSRYRIRICK